MVLLRPARPFRTNTPKDVLFLIAKWNTKVGSQETPGVTGKFDTWTSSDGQHQNQIDYLLCSQDGEALYSQQKQDQELTVAQIMNSLLPNSDFS